MSESIPDEMRPGLERFQAKLQSQMEAVRKTKIGINALYEAFELPPPYTDVDESKAATTISRGQFYGQPLATNVRTILEMRRAANAGPASIAEIHQALVQGGYAFEAKDAENAKAGLRQSLRKNPIFHRIPSGEWGLLAWYPNAKPDRDDDSDSNGNAGAEKKAKQEKPIETTFFGTQKPAASKKNDAPEDEKAASAN